MQISPGGICKTLINKEKNISLGGSNLLYHLSLWEKSYIIKE